MIHFSDYSDPQEHHGRSSVVVPPGLQSSINEIQTRNNIPTSQTSGLQIIHVYRDSLETEEKEKYNTIQSGS